MKEGQGKGGIKTKIINQQKVEVSLMRSPVKILLAAQVAKARK